MGTTKIEWTDSVWNVVSGCTPISPGCAHCYAKRMAMRLAGRCGYPPAPHEFDVTLHWDKLDEPLHWKKPRRVFVCSMSDLFHDDVPFEFVSRVAAVMQKAQMHTFQILTKRPERMLAWFVWSGFSYKTLPNVWFGVTAENQEQADKRIPILLQIPAAVRFVSVEPMLRDIVDIEDYLPMSDECAKLWREAGCMSDMQEREGKKLDWVICGGETGPGARPMDLQWARDLRDQCNAAGIPFFYKGAGTATHSKHKWGYRLLDGREWNEFPEVAE